MAKISVIKFLSKKYLIHSATLILTAIFVCAYILGSLNYKVAYNNVLVDRVVDGDTLKLNNGQRVRLLGLDTPEYHESDKLFRDSRRLKKDVKDIQAMGYDAYQYTRKLVEKKMVKLEFDVEKADKYGRLLAYVYLKDGTFVNAYLLRDGQASVCIIEPNVRYKKMFIGLEEQARAENLGIWAAGKLY
ncbi:MAG: thermonuclease family protein [Candidatus Omnitrophota bacterium]